MCAVTLVALAVCPALSRATGGGDEDDIVLSFFAPEIIGNPDELTFDSGEGSLPADQIEEVNRQEWSIYFRGKVASANLTFLIYKMKLGDLDKIIWTVEGKKNPPALSKELAAVKSELDAVGDKAQVIRALYYLGFAKRCEPIATRMQSEDAWNTEKRAAARAKDAETADKLLSASAGLVAATKDKFLQDRYRFQRLRLMFYSSRYADAQSYYAANIAAFTTESSVKYRFMHTAAGSFYRDKKYGQANYIYSLVFDHFPPLKRSSYLSFHPVEDADWKECLAKAKNDRERAVIWQMLGVYADGLAAIENIYKISPTSNLLPLLLVREVNNAEGSWSENNQKRADQVGSGRSEAVSDGEAVGKQRVALVKQLADGKKTLNPYLWQLALGHLYALAGNSKSALAALDLAEKSAPKTGAAAQQIRISRLFAKVRAMKAMDKTQEPYLAAELTWISAEKPLRGVTLDGWVRSALSKFYQKGGDSLRALLLASELPRVGKKELYPANQKLDQILQFQEKPGKSAFDEFLAGNYSFSQASMNEMKALNELYAGRFKSAADLLAIAGTQISDAPLNADPFVIHINDCHDCDFEAKRAINYTKATFVKRLIELSAQAEQPGNEGAQASFLLANGLYNMSYYGNSRVVYVASQGSPNAGDTPNNKTDLAEKYYKRAMDLSADREFKAKACFMAAKTEQTRTGVTDENTVQSPVYFKKLKTSYANTRYYKEIIKECGYFRRYLGIEKKP